MESQYYFLGLVTVLIPEHTPWMEDFTLLICLVFFDPKR